MESYFYPILSYAVDSFNLNNSCLSQLNVFFGIQYIENFFILNHGNLSEE